MTRSTLSLIFSFMLLWSACSTSGTRVSSEILHEAFASTSQQKISLKEQMGERGLVLFFYSPDCPLCINYTKTLRELMQEFGAGQFGFIAVYPDTFYTESEIASFMNDYQLSMPVILDSQKKLTDATGAEVTPEAVVLDHDGKILYKGAIDNWAYAEGKKRPSATQFYLLDALSAISEGKQPEPAITKATGCIIE